MVILLASPNKTVNVGSAPKVDSPAVSSSTKAQMMFLLRQAFRLKYYWSAFITPVVR